MTLKKILEYLFPKTCYEIRVEATKPFRQAGVHLVTVYPKLKLPTNIAVEGGIAEKVDWHPITKAYVNTCECESLKDKSKYL